jgi:superfamily I DNA/RNA helicase
LCKKGGRIVAVGDRFQSIYGFTGADTESIPKLIERLDATTLPLSITYRCPHKVVEIAQEYVPHLEAAPNAKDGVVAEASHQEFLKDVQPGDMALCRMNAPLVKACFQLISAGRKAIVRGRDIGKNLVSILGKVSPTRLRNGTPAGSVVEMLEKLNEYESKEVEKLQKRKKDASSAIEALQDKCACLRLFSDGRDDCSEIADDIDALFSDDIEGIVLSSVHKAKGLEADEVYILCPGKLPLPWVADKFGEGSWQYQQELNVAYVAYTRAKNSLTFVYQNNDDEEIS